MLQKAADLTDELIKSAHCEVYKTDIRKKDYYNLFVMEDKISCSLKEAILFIDYAKALREHNACHWLRNAKSGWSADFAVDSFRIWMGKPASATSKSHVQNHTMAEEADERDPASGSWIVTSEDPYTMTADGNKTYITEDKNFVSAECPTGYWVRKYFNPEPSQDVEAKCTIGWYCFPLCGNFVDKCRSKS